MERIAFDIHDTLDDDGDKMLMNILNWLMKYSINCQYLFGKVKLLLFLI